MPKRSTDEDVNSAFLRLLVRILDDRSLTVVFVASLINIAIATCTGLTGEPVLASPVLVALGLYDILAIVVAARLMWRGGEP